MSTRTFRLVAISAVVIVAILALSIGPLLASSVTPTHLPGASNDGKNCADVIPGSLELKIEPVPDGTYGDTDGYLSVEIVKPSTVPGTVNSFDWTSNIPVLGVVVKNGNDGANFYDYRPAKSLGDTYLTTPFNGDKGISHISFCYRPTLTATKTAHTSYTRTYTWTIDKKFDGEYWKFIGDPATTHDYKVAVDQTVVDSAFKVYGAITITNLSPYTVGYSVSDMVDGVPAAVTCPMPMTLAAGASVDCSYEAFLPAKADGTNVATVTSLHAGVDGATASAAYAFGDPTTVVGYKDINVIDTNGEAWTASGDASWDYTRDFTCPTDLSRYTDGYYKLVHENTATITETGQSDKATVTVHCYAPQISKGADTYFERDWTWTIDKVGDQSSLKLSVGQSFVVNYTVTVTAVKVDSAFKVSGVITVKNPNPNADMVVGLTDVLSDGTVATITADADCAYAAGLLTVPKGGTATCGYEAFPTDGDPGTNTATLTLNQIDFPATANYAFGAPDKETDECIDVTDDQYGSLGTVCASESPKPFSYPLTVGPYAVCGTYTYTNTASFVAKDSGATGSDTWTVAVNVPCGGCTLTQGYWKTHSKYGPAPYDDTWALLPDVDGDGVFEGEDEMFFESGKTWYEVLWTSPQGGNAYYIYAHQYIAAVLNQLNGASSTKAVNAALKFGYNPTATLGFLEKYEPDSKLTKTFRTTVLKKAAILDKYNNGLIGPGHCTEDASSVVQAPVTTQVAALPNPLWWRAGF